MIALMSKEKLWSHSIKTTCLNLQQCTLFARHEAEPSSASIRQLCISYQHSTAERFFNQTAKKSSVFSSFQVLTAHSGKKKSLMSHDSTPMFKNYTTSPNCFSYYSLQSLKCLLGYKPSRHLFKPDLLVCEIVLAGKFFSLICCKAVCTPNF